MKRYTSSILIEFDECLVIVDEALVIGAFAIHPRISKEGETVYRTFGKVEYDLTHLPTGRAFTVGYLDISVWYCLRLRAQLCRLAVNWFEPVLGVVQQDYLSQYGSIRSIVDGSVYINEGEAREYL